MSEQQRMEDFYDNISGAGQFRAHMVWSKDDDGMYAAPLARILWAGWQAAQFGQTSFNFDSPGYFGEK